MHFNITSTPKSQEEDFIIQQLWLHNSAYAPVDIVPLLITTTNDNNEIIAGLISRTWWNSLEIQYLWVNKNHRKTGIGTKLMMQAEQEAINRGCHQAYVDTFDFQAIDFYKRMGYGEYGHLDGYAHNHSRYYMSKRLI